MATVSFNQFSQGTPVTPVGNEASKDYRTNVVAPGSTFADRLKDPMGGIGKQPTADFLKPLSGLVPGLIEGTQQIGKGLYQVGQGIAEGAQGMGPTETTSASRGAMNVVAGAFNTVAAPFSTALKVGTEAVNSATGGASNKAYDEANNWWADKISNSPAVQKFAMQNPNAEEIFSNGVSMAMGLLGLKNEGAIKDGTKNAKETVVGKPPFDPESFKTQLNKNVTSGMDRAVATGDVPGESVYAGTRATSYNPTDPLNPNFAAGRISDIAANLDKAHPGMGEIFSKSIDPASTSFADLTAKANAAADTIGTIKASMPEVKTGIVPGIMKAGETFGETAKGGFENLKERIVGTPEEQSAKAQKDISTRFDKGVRPSVASTRNPKFESLKMEAVDTITKNKSNLQLENASGEVVNKLPESTREFMQALDQTKKSVFEQYDAKQKAAGGKGVAIDLNPTVKALREIGNDKAVNDLSPEIVNYASYLADKLEQRGTYDTQTTQNAIQHMNKTLEAFYRNPTAEMAKKSAVDALVVNNLRSGLDMAIETTEGPGYQDLKNKYGSLKAIEKDVRNRATVDARKNVKGLLDFSDILTGADALKAVLTMNPTELARAGIMRGIKEYYKYLNSPDTQIKKMFQLSEKYPSTTPTPPEFTQLSLPGGSKGTELGTPAASRSTGANVTAYPSEGGQIDVVDLSRNKTSVVPSQRTTGGGKAPVDPEIMSLVETAATQAEKEAIYDLSPEEVSMLNKITDKSEKARLVKDYLENQLQPNRSSSQITSPSNSMNSKLINNTLPITGKESSFLPIEEGLRSGSIKEAAATKKLLKVYPEKEPALIETLVSHAKALSEHKSLEAGWLEKQIEALPDKKHG